MKSALNDLNAYCSTYERDYSRDEDIAPLLSGGTPEGMLAAVRRVRSRENGVFLKLPMEAYRPEPDCPEIGRAPGLVLNGEGLHKALKCIELAGDEPVMLRLSGPFSAFFSAAGTDATFRWLRKNSPEVKQSLERIADGLAEYASVAAEKGARIISVADPCAMIQVLGEKAYREFAAAYLVRMLKGILPRARESVVHLCPRASRQLQESGYVTVREISVPQSCYADALLRAAPMTLDCAAGHRCVNMEQAAVDTLILLDFAGGD